MMLCREITTGEQTLRPRPETVHERFFFSICARSFDSNPNMAGYPPGLPVDMAKHRGHPLKSFSIPAPPSNTPMIPGHKPGKKLEPARS
jgi:hypothetical protein